MSVIAVLDLLAGIILNVVGVILIFVFGISSLTRKDCPVFLYSVEEIKNKKSDINQKDIRYKNCLILALPYASSLLLYRCFRVCSLFFPVTPERVNNQYQRNSCYYQYAHRKSNNTHIAEYQTRKAYNHTNGNRNREKPF